MDRPPATDVYFCPVCNKPFTLEASHTRHVQYCRRRTAAKRTARPRACRHCRSSKSKCDAQWPCSRCSSREVDCIYDKARPWTTPATPLPASGVRSSGAVSSADTTACDEAACFAAMPAPDDPLMAMLSEGSSAFSETTVATTAAATTATTLAYGYDGPVDVSSFLFSPPFYGFPSPVPPAPPTATATILSPISMHLPYAPPPEPILEALGIEKRAGGSSPQLRRLITSMVRTFPRMMTRPDSLPPFIHRVGCGLHHGGEGGTEVASLDRVVAGDDSRTPAPFAPLPHMAACIGISHAFVARTPNSDEFLWQSIDREHQSITQRIAELSLGEILVSVQAMAIYTTMRLIVYGREYFIADRSLLDTMGFHELWKGPFLPPITDDYIYDHDHDYSQDHRHDDYYDLTSASRPPPSRPAWEHWIFDETRRRITLMCWLMSLAVTPTAQTFQLMQPSRFPLPSNRKLWEASSRSAWERAYEDDRAERHALNRSSSSSGGSSTAALRTIGDLARTIDRAATAAGKPTIDALHEDDLLAYWHAGVDSLGMLLTAAAAHSSKE